MCTGAEIPAAMAAAAAGTAGAGAGAATAAEGAGLAGGALSSALASGGLEAGLLGSEAAPASLAGIGQAALNSAAPELGAQSLEGLGGMEALSGAAGPGGTSSSIGAAGGPANPFSVGLGNIQNDAMFGKLGDAANSYSKVQPFMGGQQKQNTQANVSRPPSMSNNAQQKPLAARPIGTPGPMGGGGAIGMSGLLNQAGGIDSAKALILKRLGLLGGM